MIICRRCRTHNDDGAATCTLCLGDITGADGIPVPGAAGGSGVAAPSGGRSAEPDDRLDPLPDLRPSDGSVPHDPPATDERGDVPEDQKVRWSTKQSRPKLVVRDETSAADEEVVRPERETYDHVPRGVRPDEGKRVDDDDIEEVLTDHRPLVIGGRVVTDPGREQLPPPVGSTSGPAASTTELPVEQVACPSCGEANDEHRRFCEACGATLPAFDTPRDPDDVGFEAPDSLLRRLLGTVNKEGRDGRTHAQRMRDAGQRKLTYRARRTLRARLAAVGLGAGMVGAGALALGPWRDRIEGLVQGDPKPTPAGAVYVEGGDPTDKGAADGDDTTAYEFPWTGGEGEQVVLRVDLPSAAAVEQLVFTPIPNSSDQAALFLRPSNVIVAAGGRTLELELDAGGEPQRFDVDFGTEVLQLTLTVTGVHEPESVTYDDAAFAEVGFVPR